MKKIISIVDIVIEAELDEECVWPEDISPQTIHGNEK